MVAAGTRASRAQMGLAADGADLGNIWLEPSKGGYDVILGASRPKERIAYVQKDSDGQYHVNRLDMIEAGYPTAQAAAEAFLERQKEDKKL